MRRLLVVYNTRSTRHKLVDKEVLQPLRELVASGQTGQYMVGKYDIQEASIEDNIRNISRLLMDGDLMVVAGGDGTATVAMNGALQSKHDVKVAVMGYGNFNDMAGMIGVKRPVEYAGKLEGGIKEIIRKAEEDEVEEVHPLSVKVNGKLWRYAICYATIGMFAESTAVFDEPKVRKKLLKRTGKAKFPVFSLWTLAKWYFGNRKRGFLPASQIRVNGVKVPAGATDYIAVNSQRMAKVLKGGDWYKKQKDYGRTVVTLANLWSLVKFMAKGHLSRMKLTRTDGDEIEFMEPSEVVIQAEGEAERLTGVKKIEVLKERVLKVVR